MGRLMKLLGFQDAAALRAYLDSFTHQRQRPPRHLELALQECMEDVAGPAERAKPVAPSRVAVPGMTATEAGWRDEAGVLHVFRSGEWLAFESADGRAVTEAAV